MEDKIKSLISRIEQLESESEGDESIGAGIELGKLYSRMKELNWLWNTRAKVWMYDDTADIEEEDTDEIPEKL